MSVDFLKQMFKEGKLSQQSTAAIPQSKLPTHHVRRIMKPHEMEVSVRRGTKIRLITDVKRQGVGSGFIQAIDFESVWATVYWWTDEHHL